MLRGVSLLGLDSGYSVMKCCEFVCFVDLVSMLIGWFEWMVVEDFIVWFGYFKEWGFNEL